MREKLSFWVAGGDMRQAKLAEQLAADGHTVHTFAMEKALPLSGVETQGGLERAALARCVVLPLPVAGQGNTLNAPLAAGEYPLEQILDALRPDQIIFAGMVRAQAAAMACTRGLTFHDYFAREELAVSNAVPTAEGAIQIAMEELPITIHGAQALVLGYGRLGRALSGRLAALGAQVRVAARKWADLAWAESCGYTSVPLSGVEGCLADCDLVINTVPAPVLNRSALAALRPDCLVVDLASKPGGVDFEAAARMGIRAVWALSLPGKVAPVTAGKSIKNTIYNILHELGV
jgi:dipicolinate synthase subunit A